MSTQAPIPLAPWARLYYLYYLLASFNVDRHRGGIRHLRDEHVRQLRRCGFAEELE